MAIDLNFSRRLAGLFFVAALLVCGCSEQIYYSTQQWQRSQCREIDEQSAKDNCLKQTDTSYQQYSVGRLPGAEPGGSN